MRKPVAVRLSAELVDRLDRQADRRLVSRNLLITRACEQLLDQLEDTSDWLDNQAGAA